MADYKLTNVIFTDKNPISKDNLSRNIEYNGEENIKNCNQREIYDELLEDEEIKINKFANSFLIEIFNGEYEENEIKLVAFSNMRKPQYRIKTIMTKDFVYKYAGSRKSEEHIKNIKKNIDIMVQSGLKTLDTYDDEKIISKYSGSSTLDKVIIQQIKQGNKEKAVDLIKRFKQELLEKLEKVEKENNVFDKYNIKYTKENIENMTFVKYGLWDLIFQNCFYIENEFYFYDQEWEEDNIPIDFILYRAIKYFDRIKKHIPEKELDTILKIDEDALRMFEELDNKLQEQIRDEITWKLVTQGKTALDIKRKKLTDNHTINLLRIKSSEKDKLIKQQEKEIEELRSRLNSVYNSKSWRITEPLRKIKRLGNSK